MSERIFDTLQAEEHQVYRVAAQVTLMRDESDNDLNPVIQDAARRHMIVELFDTLTTDDEVVIYCGP